MSTETLTQLLTEVKNIQSEVTNLKSEFHLYLNGDPVNDIPGNPERIRQLKAHISSLEKRLADIIKAKNSNWERVLNAGNSVALLLIGAWLLQKFGLG